MSANDALFVQQRKDGLYAVQHGFMEEGMVPDPETAVPEDLFKDLGEIIQRFKTEADETEYGFRFQLPREEFEGS